jgi:hypothetical protein
MGEDKVKINKDIYEKLLNTPEVPPESGGILGGKDQIISKVMFDQGLITREGQYKPDVMFLNQTIKGWSRCGIEFYGIFHTHAKQWLDLSGEDKKYIVKIMNSMPDSVHEILFPIVFPEYTVSWFKAEKHYETVDIREISIEIFVEGGEEG